MAGVPYNEGLATVTPETQAPSDYEHVEASPNSFGASIASGMQQAGQGAVKLGQFWGEVQGDTVMNNALKDGNKVIEDFKATRGQNTLDAQKTIDKNLDDIQTNYRSQLQTPDQQKRFDEQFRPFRDRYWAGQITSHATQQGYSFAKDTNDTAFNLASQRAADPSVYGDEDGLKHAFADAQSATHKQLQVDGQDQNQDAITAANLKASQAVYGTAAQAMAAHGDVVGAQKFINDHQKELGSDYDKLSDHFRVRADQQSGNAAAKDEIAKATVNPAPQRPLTFGPAPGANGVGLTNTAYTKPLDQPAASGISPKMAYGFAKAAGATDNEALMLTGAAASESSFKPTQVHDDGAGYGLFGHNTRRLDLHGVAAPQQFAAALQELRSRPESALVNAATTPEQLAVAQMHFEQPMGYTHANPEGGLNFTGRLNTLRYFSQLTGTPAFTGPGGSVVPGGGQPMTMPASVSGAPAAPGLPPVDAAPPPLPPTPTKPDEPIAPPTPEQIKASAYQAIRDRTDLSDEAKQHAYSAINQQITEQQVMEQATASAKKKVEEAQVDHYISQIGLHQSPPDIVRQIYSDPKLTGETKYRLANIAKAETGQEDKADLGTGYDKAFQRIMAPPGSQDRIGDPNELLRMTDAGDLSSKGYARLSGYMRDAHKDLETRGVLTAKSEIYKYAEKQLSFDGTMSFPGMPPLKDPEGAKLFSSTFVPAFESAYDKMIKDGTDPYKFLAKENIDKIISALPNKRTMAQTNLDRANAENELPAGKEAAAIPNAPEGVDPKEWLPIIKAPPLQDNGTPWQPHAWSIVINTLRENPTPETKAYFDQHFASKGYTADDMLKKLPPTPGAAPTTLPPAAALADRPATAEPPPAPAAPRNHPIANAAHQIHEWLQGDPQHIIDEVQSGRFADPNSPLGRAVLAEQQRRLAERQKEKAEK